MTKKQLAQQEAIQYLKQFIKPNSRITVIQKSVSRSGMCRRLKLLVDTKDITYDVGQAIDWSVNDKGLRVDGCGMDMHFHTIDTLSYTLFGKKKYKAFKGNGGTCLAWTSL